MRNGVNRFLMALLMGLAAPLLSMATGAAWAQAPDARTVWVIGQSEIKDGDQTAARRAAIADALVAAVDQVALSLLPEELARGRFQQLNRALWGETEALVMSYEVMSAGFVSTVSYRILVRASVSADRLKERFATAAVVEEKRPEMPSLALFIAEQRMEGGPVRYWWRGAAATGDDDGKGIAPGAMAAALGEKGYTVMADAASIHDPDLMARIGHDPYIEPSEALAVARLLGADAALVGTAAARKTLNIIGQELKTFSGTVSARAFRAGDGQEIAAVTQTSVESSAEDDPGRNAALEKAALLAAEDLAGRLAAAWAPAAGGPPEGLSVIVGGTRRLGHFVMFRRQLSQLPGVSDIRLMEMRANEATIGVACEQDGLSLAEALKALTFDDFTLKFLDVKTHELRLELAPN